MINMVQQEDIIISNMSVNGIQQFFPMWWNMKWNNNLMFL